MDHETFRHAIDVISRFLLYPLALSTSKQSRLARHLLKDFKEAVRPSYFPAAEKLELDIKAALTRLPATTFLDYFRAVVDTVPIPEPPADVSVYYDSYLPLVSDETWNLKGRKCTDF